MRLIRPTLLLASLIISVTGLASETPTLRWVDPVPGTSWAAVIEGREWIADGEGDYWHADRSLSELLVALNLATVRSDAPKRLTQGPARMPIGPASTSGQSRVNFKVDGFYYSPSLEASYLPNFGIFIITTGRNLSCSSAGNSAMRPVSPIEVYVDGSRIRLDGSVNAPELAYNLAENTLHIQSRDLDVVCREGGVHRPDAIRLSLSGPAESGSGAPTPFVLRTNNLTSVPATQLLVTVELPAGALFAGASGALSCSQSGSQLNCSRGTVSAGADLSTTLNIRLPPGESTLSCTGSIAGAGRVSGEACFQNTAVTDQIFRDRFYQ